MARPYEYDFETESFPDTGGGGGGGGTFDVTFDSTFV